MKFNPAFYGVVSAEEVTTLQLGLNRLEEILGTGDHTYPQGMDVDVWASETGTDIFPRHHPPINGYTVDVDNNPGQNKIPIRVYFPKDREYIRFGIGGETAFGQESARLNAFNLYYAPLTRDQYAVLKAQVDSSLKKLKKPA